MSNIAPIVLFVYNRPYHTKKTVEALLRNEYASESELIIFADGPKDNATEKDKKNICATREYCHSICGFKNVIIHEAAHNKGLDPSEIDGISQIVNEYGRVIVLEDDLITNKYFLRFMNEALEFYEDNKRIFQIAGFVDNIRFPKYFMRKHSIWVSYRVESCGWATWKDRWEKNQWNEAKYDIIKNPNRSKIRKFNRGGEDLYDQLLSKYRGETDAWDIRWQHCLYENDALCIRPIYSFLYNIGFDGTGIHSGNVDLSKILEQTAPLFDETQYNLKLENNIQIDDNVQHRLRQFFKIHRINFWMYCKRKVKKMLTCKIKIN